MGLVRLLFFCLLTMTEDRWLKTSGAVNALSISRATLQRRKKEGYLQKGKHWITAGPFSRSPVLWNVDSIRKLMSHWDGPAVTSRSEVAK